MTESRRSQRIRSIGSGRQRKADRLKSSQAAHGLFSAARRASRKSSRSSPSGVFTDMPVTATRLLNNGDLRDRLGARGDPDGDRDGTDGTQAAFPVLRELRPGNGSCRLPLFIEIGTIKWVKYKGFFRKNPLFHFRTRGATTSARMLRASSRSARLWAALTAVRKRSWSSGTAG